MSSATTYKIQCDNARENLSLQKLFQFISLLIYLIIIYPFEKLPETAVIMSILSLRRTICCSEDKSRV